MSQNIARFLGVMFLQHINPFTPADSVMSKIIDKFSKITNWVKLKNKKHCSKVLLRVLSIESKIRKLYHPRFDAGGQRVKNQRT